MKKYLWMSSAAVVIGALRVKCRTSQCMIKPNFLVTMVTNLQKSILKVANGAYLYFVLNTNVPLYF